MVLLIIKSFLWSDVVKGMLSSSNVLSVRVTLSLELWGSGWNSETLNSLIRPTTTQWPLRTIGPYDTGAGGPKETQFLSLSKAIQLAAGT